MSSRIRIKPKARQLQDGVLATTLPTQRTESHPAGFRSSAPPMDRGTFSTPTHIPSCGSRLFAAPAYRKHCGQHLLIQLPLSASLMHHPLRNQPRVLLIPLKNKQVSVPRLSCGKDRHDFLMPVFRDGKAHPVVSVWIRCYLNGAWYPRTQIINHSLHHHICN